MNYWIKRILFILRKNLLFKEIKAHLKHRLYFIDSKKILPIRKIEEIIPNVSSQLINSEFEDGNVSSLELDYISRIVKAHNPLNIFEFGTFNGRTTLHLAANTKEETRIFTLDLPIQEISNTVLRIKSGEKKFIRKNISGAYFLGTEYEHRIFQIYSDSASFDYQPYLNKMDFIFIDGSHSYEYVKSDTQNALKLLRNGKGIIIWHDYGWSEVIQALNELYLNDSRFTNLQQIENTSFAYIKFE